MTDETQSPMNVLQAIADQEFSGWPYTVNAESVHIESENRILKLYHNDGTILAQVVCKTELGTALITSNHYKLEDQEDYRHLIQASKELLTRGKPKIPEGWKVLTFAPEHQLADQLPQGPNQ